MVIGFVLIHVSTLRESEVFNKLSKLHEVIEVHPLLGEYDFMQKLKQRIMKASEKLLFIRLNQ